ncbi:MAG TPA: hypothetical protein VIJ03_00060 [Candidatus Dormibacteraeota bacterium]
MLDGTLKDAGDAEQQLLGRALGALISLRRFDSPVHLARAVHGATLALSLYVDGLPAVDAQRIKDLRAQSLQVALSDALRGISEVDRDWLIATMRNVLGKAGEVALAENRLH